MSDTSKKRNLTTSPNSRFIAATAFVGIAIAMTAFSGCSLIGIPRARSGHLATNTNGIPFPDPDKLGRHSYDLGIGEVGGIVYTCKAGHVDLDHVRGNADNTRFLVKKIRRALSKNSKGFSFVITGELSSHHIKLTYPEGWKTNPDRENIIEEIAFSTAPYLSYTATIWHEILTWYGVHFMGFEPEFNSAFSWEDIYSNLIGTKLGVIAMKNPDLGFDEAMTNEIYRELKELNVQPRTVAIRASDNVRGDWYTGFFVPDTKMRNFDIGLDGFVTPTLVPGIEECEGVKPLPMAVPTLDVLKQHGFSMTHQIRPNVLEQGRIFKAAGTNKIFVEIHIPIIMEDIKKEAVEKGYKYTE